MREVPDVMEVDGIEYELSPEQKAAIAHEWEEYQKKWQEGYKLHRRVLEEQGLSTVLDGGESFPGSRKLWNKYLGRMRAIATGEAS